MCPFLLLKQTKSHNSVQIQYWGICTAKEIVYHRHKLIGVKQAHYLFRRRQINLVRIHLIKIRRPNQQDLASLSLSLSLSLSMEEQQDKVTNKINFLIVLLNLLFHFNFCCFYYLHDMIKNKIFLGFIIRN